jgi:hypothetical protein
MTGPVVVENVNILEFDVSAPPWVIEFLGAHHIVWLRQPVRLIIEPDRITIERVDSDAS